MLRRQSGVSCVAAILVCLAAMGCGGKKTYPVTGTVKIAGQKPLAGGTIEFQPLDQPQDKLSRIAARGQIGADGTFKLSTFAPGDGAPPGQYRALIVPPLAPGKIDGVSHPKPVINNRYLNFETSGLQFTVDAGEKNDFQINLDPP